MYVCFAWLLQKLFGEGEFQIITTMSSNTLHKRLDQRRSMSSIAVRVPNPFLINGAARPGSARFVSARSRPMLSRNSTIDFFDQVTTIIALLLMFVVYSVVLKVRNL